MLGLWFQKVALIDWGIKDEEVEFKITSAANKTYKVRTVLFGVNINMGETTVKVLAIVLEGLHFDVRLGSVGCKKQKRPSL